MAGRLVLGAALIAIGGLYLLASATDVNAGEIIATWWPSLLVAFAVIQLILDRRAVIGSATLAVVGFVLLGFTTGGLSGSAWGIIWPTLFLAGGLALVVPRVAGLPEGAGDTVRAFAVFSARRLSSRSSKLRGGDLTAVLGSVQLDLTEASIARDARIVVTSVLGSCEIVVPPGWEIHISGVPLLGMWDDTTRRNGLAPGAPVLRVSAFVMLGNLEVRHPERWG